MTRLLVSVRNASEAREALAGGADLIDVKEPSLGAMGAAGADTWSEVVAAVAGRAPVSVSLGELCSGAVPVTHGLAADLCYAKLGLAGCARTPDWPARWAAALSLLAGGVPPVAVAYADYATACAPAPYEVLRHGLPLGCRALLVDTFDKSRGALLDYLPNLELTRLIDTARASELTVALGGSLNSESLPVVLALAPDYVAVRGAACRPTRCGTVDQRLVRRLAGLIRRSQTQRFNAGFA